MSLAPSIIIEHDRANVYDDGYLRVEHDNYYVTCQQRIIELSRVEFLILSRLVRSFARLVPAEELWRFVWSDSKPFNPFSIKVYIYRLRHKLAPYNLKIETMKQVGYRLIRSVD